MPPRIDTGAHTDQGPRATNQDAVRVDDQAGFAVVADGMGGAAGGEIASMETVLAVQRVLAATNRAPALSLAHLLERACQEANSRVQERAQADPDLAGMGSTLAAVVVGAGRYGVANVGDSRVYLLRRGVLTQLSHDHSRVQERVDAGLISPQEARHQPDRNVITQAIGAATSVSPHLVEGDLEPGDCFLLTSDGVHGVLEEPDLAAMPADEASAATAQRLVAAALARGTGDNATVAALRVLHLDTADTRQHRGWAARIPWLGRR